MTLSEFKAWLEGYEASFPPTPLGVEPSPQQWAEVKRRLATVTTGADAKPRPRHDPGDYGPNNPYGDERAGGPSDPSRLAQAGPGPKRWVA